MLICLHVEVVCLLSDVMRHSQPRVTLREVGLTLSFVAALCLVVFTSVDMFFTAKYFHVPDVSDGDFQGGVLEQLCQDLTSNGFEQEALRFPAQHSFALE